MKEASKFLDLLIRYGDDKAERELYLEDFINTYTMRSAEARQELIKEAQYYLADHKHLNFRSYVKEIKFHLKGVIDSYKYLSNLSDTDEFGESLRELSKWSSGRYKLELETFFILMLAAKKVNKSLLIDDFDKKFFKLANNPRFLEHMKENGIICNTSISGNDCRFVFDKECVNLTGEHTKLENDTFEDNILLEALAELFKSQGLFETYTETLASVYIKSVFGDRTTLGENATSILNFYIKAIPELGAMPTVGKIRTTIGHLVDNYIVLKEFRRDHEDSKFGLADVLNSAYDVEYESQLVKFKVMCIESAKFGNGSFSIEDFEGCYSKLYTSSKFSDYLTHNAIGMEQDSNEYTFNFAN